MAEEDNIGPDRRKGNAERAVMKEALKEWLDEQWATTYQTIGRWTVEFLIRCLILMLFSAMVHVIIHTKADDLKEVVLHAYQAAHDAVE